MPTIYEVKERSVVETPLILFECILPNASIERWSTHDVTVEGVTYDARVLQHNLFDMKWSSDEGVDTIHRVSISLLNADSHFSQLSQSPGWKGAQLTATFLFYDLVQNAPATSGTVVFRGIVGSPDETTETSIRISAANRLNPQRMLVPDIRIQRRCPWSFPGTAAQRDEALGGGPRGKYSPYSKCGYSAGVQGGMGNLDGSVPYTSCDYTRASCEARGMFDRDSQNQVTRRFGGFDFVPSATLVRSSGERGQHLSVPAENRARYNDFVPLCYGTVWIQPPVMFSRNDGNLTRIEVLLGSGEIQGVVKVIVSGVEIPAGVSSADMTASGWYNLVSTGTASGGFNLDFTDASGHPLGDPYGSMAYLSVVVPNRLNDGDRLPKVDVLLEGLRLPTFDAAGDPSGEHFSANPAWILLDLLRRAGWTLGEIDLSSFHRAAAFCDEPLTIPDLYGNPVSSPRFRCNFAVRRRRSLADCIRGVRVASRLYLRYDTVGRLAAAIEGPLSIESPELPPGSNSTAPLNDGWPAYEFGDGSNGFSGILRRRGGSSSVRLWTRGANDTPNRTSIEFQDEFNDFQQDSLSLADLDDVNLLRQETAVQSAALGVSNFHHALRVLSLQLAKSIRGNLYIEFETSVKGVSLRPGDIITVTYQKEGLNRAPFRIIQISPALNFGTALIRAQVHDDDWYTDEPPGAGGSRVGRRQGTGGIGVPLPLVGVAFDVDGETTFAVSEAVEEDGDGSSLVRLSVEFSPPSQVAKGTGQIPYVGLLAQVTPTGGSLAGGRDYYYAITGVDSSGGESAPSFFVRAIVAPGTDTNTARLTGMRFAGGTVAFHVYRGLTPARMYRIAGSLPIAAEYLDAGAAGVAAGPPDENFDHARFEWRFELHPEVPVTGASSTSVSASTLQLTPDVFAGMVVRVSSGKGRGQERVIVSHTENTITIRGAWASLPDSTSSIVIAEPSWQFGATTPTSPARWLVPNRPGTSVHICGKAVNALGRDSGFETAPLTRVQIGGAGAGGVDSDVPPPALFGLLVRGQGVVELQGLGFPSLANTRGIYAATLRLFFWDELTGNSPLEVSGDLLPAVTTMFLSGPSAVQPGELLQVGAELVVVTGRNADGSVLEVIRGSHDTADSFHLSGTAVLPLLSRVSVIPFAKDFFGSPASGAFSYSTVLPDVRIAAADLWTSNGRGNSETSKVAFTSTVDGGLRTLSGGQLTIQVAGHLAIETSAAPPLVVESAHAIRDVFAVMEHGPTSAPVVLRLRVDGTEMCTLTIPAGGTQSNVVDGLALPPLAALSKIVLDVVSVGTAPETSPGRDLTVIIRL